MLYDSREAARRASRGDLDIVACLQCGFVFNAAFDSQLMRYGAGYDNDQSCSPAFNSHVDAQLDHLLNEEGIRNCRIVEVGCGKGDFLRKLVERPGSGNMGWGFDPSYAGPDTALDGRLRFVRSFYTPEHTGIAADVVICRHVIEHVPDPNAFLKEIQESSSGARVFFETPCVEWILRNEVLWDFFYEHCSYFSPQSIATAFRQAGFGNLTISHVFGGQYLWLEGTAMGEHAEKRTCEPGGIAQLAEQYARGDNAARARWTGTIESLRNDGAIALWGAGAKGVTCASLLDPQAELISCVVDLNPAKQGRFVAGSGQPIVAASELTKFGVTNVIVMNPNYLGEVRQMLMRDGLNLNVVVEADASALRGAPKT